MGLALSNNIDEKSISWNKTSLIKNSSWELLNGGGKLDTIIELEPESELGITLNCADKNYRAEYLKILTHLSCSDTNLTTDNVHNVCVICEIVYQVEKEEGNQEETVIYEFYPKYDFEETFKEDYTIVQGINGKIISIEMTLYNYENQQIQIKNSGLYLSKIINEDTVNDAVNEAVNNAFNDNFNEKMSCIEVLEKDPDPSFVPNGINANHCYMWILKGAIE